MASDTQDALKLLEEKKFDVLIVDSVLKNTDGITLAGKIREHRNGRNTPILLMSPIDTSLARRMAKDVGCNEFLPKPFGPAQLIEQVKKLEAVTRSYRSYSLHDSHLIGINGADATRAGGVGNELLKLGAHVERRAGVVSGFPDRTGKFDDAFAANHAQHRDVERRLHDHLPHRHRQRLVFH